MVARLAHSWPAGSIKATYKCLLNIDGIGLGVGLRDGMAWCFLANKWSLLLPRKAKVSSEATWFPSARHSRSSRAHDFEGPRDRFPYLQMRLVFPGGGFLRSQIGAELRFHLDVGLSLVVAVAREAASGLALMTREIVGDGVAGSGFGTLVGGASVLGVLVVIERS